MSKADFKSTALQLDDLQELTALSFKWELDFPLDLFLGRTSRQGYQSHFGNLLFSYLVTYEQSL